MSAFVSLTISEIKRLKARLGELERKIQKIQAEIDKIRVLYLSE